MNDNFNPPAVIGEAIAGESAKIFSEIETIIHQQNTSTFTLAKLLHTVKTKQLYVPRGFDTFRAYAKSLSLKVSKAYYLTRIVECMEIAGVPDATWQPVGIAKLRIITRLDPVEEYEGKLGAVYIKALTESALTIGEDVLMEAVSKIQGKVGDDEDCWLNLRLTRAQRDKTILKAIENMRAQLGTVGEKEGAPVDSSDGRCLELICAEFLSGAPSLEGDDSPANGTI
jgi:hypothetical protein